MRSGNGVLEDVSAVIGFTATMRLVALHPGNLYVPMSIQPGCRLVTLVGERALAKLIEEWGGEQIEIPSLAEFDGLRLLPSLARRLAAGESTKDIARSIGLTETHVRRLRSDAEEFGLLRAERSARDA